jgi:conjugative transposon TraK protein
MAQSSIIASQGKVFVLSNGKLLEANAVNRKQQLPVEVRDHVNTFHQYFFNLEPDEQLIRKQVGKALYLCDQSARLQYNNLNESGYYAGIVSGNISQRLETDSILVDLNTSPWSVNYYGKLSIIRPTSVVIRLLVTQAVLRDLGTVSDNNPHGFLLEHWKIVDNHDIASYPR